ncbi:MAG: hydroxyacid dehydrogenase [Paenibacillus sp.]|nr:hydroxyacid dehydrogenase [Paenibacillus sp.]
MLDTVCSPACRSVLEEQFEPLWNETGAHYTQEQVAERIGEAEVVLTSWGSPALSVDALRRAGKLRYIGHAAGSMKHLLPENILESGRIRIFSAAPRIALSVAEYCLAAAMSCLWRLPRLDEQVRSGVWRSGAFGRELRGRTVGIVSASSTARAFIELLKPFDVRIKLYDPYWSAAAIESLGAVKAELEEAMQCSIVSVHAPALPETKGMLTAELLRLIPDGGVFINSSRGAVLDEAALIRELRTGRFSAALDVLSPEPPAPDHPLFGMSHVLLTPHVAGMTVEGCLSLMGEVVDDIRRAMDGAPTRYEVGERAWKVMA